MKQLCAFLLLCAGICGAQSYSGTALQNSPGSYARALSYAQVLLCVSTDTAVPCTQKAATYTTDALSVRCTTTAASGVLPGAPTSGTTCNNPGNADVNGNFTIFALSGNYQLCVSGQEVICQEITVGGGGVGNINCPGALFGSVAAFTNPITVGCDIHAGTDFLGDFFFQSTQTVGPVNGFRGFTGGASDPLGCPQTPPAPCFGLANTFYELAPLTIATPYALRWPNTVPTAGQVLDAASISVINGVPVVLGSWLTPSSNGVTFQTNGVDNASQVLLNLVPGSGITIVNTSGGIDTISATGSGGTVTSITATSPVVATPSPITGVGVISCATCLTSIPAQYKIHSVSIPIGTNNGSALANADLGPQTNLVYLDAAGTLQEVTFAVDNASSTTNIQVRKRHCATFTTGTCTAFTVTNLLSGVLAAASTANATACAMSTTSATCIDGTTSSSSVTISTTALAAGDWLEFTSGTADGVTKAATVSFTWTN